MVNSRPFFRQALDYNASCSSVHTPDIWDDNTPDPRSLFERSDQSLDLEEVVINSSATDRPQNQEVLRTVQRVANSVQDDTDGEVNPVLSQVTGSESISSLGESLNSSARFFLLPVLPSKDKAQMLLVKRSLMLRSSRIAAQNAAYGAHCIAASTTAGSAKTPLWMMLSLLIGGTVLSAGIAVGFIAYFSDGLASFFSEAPSPNAIKRAIGQVPFDQVGLALLVEHNVTGSSIEHQIFNELGIDAIHVDQDMLSSNIVEGSDPLHSITPALLTPVPPNLGLLQPTRSPERKPVPPKAITESHSSLPSVHPTRTSSVTATPNRYHTVPPSTYHSSLKSLPDPSASAIMNTKQEFSVPPSQTPEETRDPLEPASLGPYSGLSSTMMPEMDVLLGISTSPSSVPTTQSPTRSLHPPPRTSVSPILSPGAVGHGVSSTNRVSTAPLFQLSNFPGSIPSEAPFASPSGESSAFPTNIATWSTFRSIAPNSGMSEQPYTLSSIKEGDHSPVIDDHIPASPFPSLFHMSSPSLTTVNFEESPVVPTMASTSSRESHFVGIVTQPKAMEPLPPVVGSTNYSPTFLYTIGPTFLPSVQPSLTSQAKKDTSSTYFTMAPTYRTFFPSKSPSESQRSSSFDPIYIPSSGSPTVSAQPSIVPRSGSSVDPSAFSETPTVSNYVTRSDPPTDKSSFFSLTPSLVQSATGSTRQTSQSVFPSLKPSNGPSTTSSILTGTFSPSESHLSIGQPTEASTMPNSIPSSGQSRPVNSDPSSISTSNPISFLPTKPSSLPSPGVSTVTIRGSIPTRGPSESTPARLSSMPNSGVSIPSIAAVQNMPSTQPSSKPSSSPSILNTRRSTLPSTQPSSMPSPGPCNGQIPSSAPISSNGQFGIMLSQPNPMTNSLPPTGQSELSIPQPSSMFTDSPAPRSDPPTDQSAFFSLTPGVVQSPTGAYPPASQSAITSLKPSSGPSTTPSTLTSSLSSPGSHLSIGEPTAASTMPNSIPSSGTSTGPSGLITSNPSSISTNDPSTFPSTQPGSLLGPSQSATGNDELPIPNPSSIPTAGIESALSSTQPVSTSSSSPPVYSTHIHSDRSSIPTLGHSESTSARISSKPSSGLPIRTSAVRKSSSQPSSKPSCGPSFPSTLPSTMPSTQPSSIPSPGPPNGQISSSAPISSNGQFGMAPTQPNSMPTSFPPTGQSELPISQPSSMFNDSLASTPTDSLTSCTPSSGQFSSSNSVGPFNTASTQPTVSLGQGTSIPSRNTTSSSHGGSAKTPSALPTLMPSASPISTGPLGLSTSISSTGPSLGRYGSHTSIPSSGSSTMPLKMPSWTPNSVPIAGQPVIPPKTPFSVPSNVPLVQPSSKPSSGPSVVRSLILSSNPTSVMTHDQRTMPPLQPSSMPNRSPSSDQSTFPHSDRSSFPTGDPSATTSTSLSHASSTKPSTQPSLMLSSAGKDSKASSIPSSGPSATESTPSTPTVSFEMDPTKVESQPPVLLYEEEITKTTKEPTEHPSQSSKVIVSFHSSGNPSVAPLSLAPSNASPNPTQRRYQSTVRPSGVPSGLGNLDDPSRGISSSPPGKLTDPPNNEQADQLQSNDCSILGFTLWDADRNKRVRPLLDGSVVCPSPLRFNIEAVVHPGDCEEPVTMDYSGPRLKSSRVERFSPYLAFGDIPQVDVKGRWMREGEIRVSATLLHAKEASQSATIEFRVGTDGCH